MELESNGEGWLPCWKKKSMKSLVHCLCLCLFLHHLIHIAGTPTTSSCWDDLPSPDGVKFSGRNAHASCIFKGKIWVTGGRTNSYTKYNLDSSYKVADVWKSSDGATWVQETSLTGDFYAQNIDVVQPGSIAPWFERYGHSLDAVDIDGDGVDDLMVLMGGFSPFPSNDLWVTENGNNWLYAGTAPWSARAWHATAIFKEKLWMMGGTPLNNEVWMLNNVTKVSRVAPLTRSLYSNYTYSLNWTRLPDAPWSPRVGAGLVSQCYWDSSSQTYSDGKERLVLLGGYGGWLNYGANASAYDGFYCRGDSWESYDGRTWTKLNSSAISGRAWFGMAVMHADNACIDIPLKSTAEPPKIYVFGGGYIGYSTASPKRVTSMSGYADAYWSRDGMTWVKISYEEGGGTSTVPFYSSQEWSATTVDSANAHLGKWGLSVHSFNFTTKEKYPGDFILIAGDFTGGGDMSAETFRSLDGLFCDISGVVCNGQGSCSSSGCVCNSTYTGTNCQTYIGTDSSAPLLRALPVALASLLMTLFASRLYFD